MPPAADQHVGVRGMPQEHRDVPERYAEVRGHEEDQIAPSAKHAGLDGVAFATSHGIGDE
jgi:hypothetical protein